MPTHEEAPGFLRGYDDLPRRERSRFREALQKFKEDLVNMESDPSLWFRPSLGVKKVKGLHDVFEMSWDRRGDGRATFSFGEERQRGKRHVVWHAIGGHEILP